jgi:hypothetical protein
VLLALPSAPGRPSAQPQAPLCPARPLPVLVAALLLLPWLRTLHLASRRPVPPARPGCRPYHQPRAGNPVPETGTQAPHILYAR